MVEAVWAKSLSSWAWGGFASKRFPLAQVRWARGIRESFYICWGAELLVTMRKVAFVHHLTVTVLLEVPAAGGFILKVYISVIRVN